MGELQMMSTFRPDIAYDREIHVNRTACPRSFVIFLYRESLKKNGQDLLDLGSTLFL